MNWKFVNNDIVLQAQRRKTLEIMDASNHWTHDLEKHLSSILIFGIWDYSCKCKYTFTKCQIELCKRKKIDDRRYVSNTFEQYMPTRVAMQTWNLSKKLYDWKFQGKKFTQKTRNFRHLLNRDKKCVNALNWDKTSKKCS